MITTSTLPKIEINMVIYTTNLTILVVINYPGSNFSINPVDMIASGTVSLHRL